MMGMLYVIPQHLAAALVLTGVCMRCCGIMLIATRVHASLLPLCVRNQPRNGMLGSGMHGIIYDCNKVSCVTPASSAVRRQPCNRCVFRAWHVKH